MNGCLCLLLSYSSVLAKLESLFAVNSSRGIRVPHNVSVWQQASGLAAGTGSWALTSSAPRGKQADSWKQVWGFLGQSPLPGCAISTSTNSVTSWAPRVQMPEIEGMLSFKSEQLPVWGWNRYLSPIIHYQLLDFWFLGLVTLVPFHPGSSEFCRYWSFLKLFLDVWVQSC